MGYTVHILELISKNPIRAVGTGLRFIAELRMDRRIGVATLRRDFSTYPSATGDSHPCQPVPYVVLKGIARFIEERKLPLTTFYDVGCGVGRPLAYLSRLGFARMTGIEINPDVAARARWNLARIRADWRRAGSMGVESADVLSTAFDFMGGIVYLANPFGPATMQAFVDKLRAQVLARPELELHLLYAHPHYDDVIEHTFPGAPRVVIEGLQLCFYYRLNAAALAPSA